MPASAGYSENITSGAYNNKRHIHIFPFPPVFNPFADDACCHDIPELASKTAAVK